MAWKDRLQSASFRGVPFKVEDEDSTGGRRVETHEYPNRDKPYTEDLGKATFRASITAYVIGDDCFEQRDALREALNKPGPGTLIHPTFGELSVCVDGEIRISTSRKEGRMVRFDLRFVESGELAYPTSGAATAQMLESSCSAFDSCISDAFDGFGMDGMADFVQQDVIGQADGMIGYVSDAMKMIDDGVSAGARLLQGDISVLLPPPSSGKGFIESLQKMWRTGNRLYGNSSDLITMAKTLSGISLGKDLAPRGVWKTDSQSTKSKTEQRNYVASAIRTTALSEAVYTVTSLPAPSAVSSTGTSGQSPAIVANVSHPALNNAPTNTVTPDAPSWDELTAVRDNLNQAIVKEMERTTDDRVFTALRRLKSDLNTDITQRLRQTDKTVTVLPAGIEPAVVLAARVYDDASRATEIVQRNGIAHPGFVPLQPLKLSTRQLAWRVNQLADQDQLYVVKTSDWLRWGIAVEKACSLGF
ncbi:TPA: DNA circularization N-terminal domain-containing protein [Citrobacter freundii]|nr:DNA circularization N-terminal domain-containing protein [Citrobacter freundii]